MTDMPPPAEDDDGTVLARFRTAVHELYLASLPDGLRPPGTNAADAAAALVEVREQGVNRVFRLHAVASNLNRRPDLVDEPDEPVRRMAEAVFDPANEEQAVDVLEFGLRRFALSAPGTGSALTPARWRTFLRDIGEPGFRGELAAADADLAPRAARAPDPVLVYKPGCNDEEVTDSPAGAACTIRSRFYLDGDLGTVGRFIDPRRWVTCGRPFWTEMSVLDDSFKGDDSAFTAVFCERVNLPVVETVTAVLRITYTATPDFILTEYVVADDYDNPDVVFDNGWLMAVREHENGQSRILVDGVKSIRFVRDDLNDYPDLACDGAWVHFMINMALGGDGLPAGAAQVPRARLVRPSKTSAGVAAGVGGAIDEWVAGAKASLDDHGRHAKAAVAKALAEPSDPRWVNDVLGDLCGRAEDGGDVHEHRAGRARGARLPGREAMTDPKAWPTPNQLVGVWATAVTQVWDISRSWWKVALEGGAAEDATLTSWSTTVGFPGPPPAGGRYRCDSFTDVAGKAVPARTELRLVAANGPGDDCDLQVRVTLAGKRAGSLYRFTICELGADGLETGRKRTYLRGFGVPGS